MGSSDNSSSGSPKATESSPMIVDLPTQWRLPVIVTHPDNNSISNRRLGQTDIPDFDQIFDLAQDKIQSCHGFA